MKITSWMRTIRWGRICIRRRLDSILELGAQADKDALASAGLTSAGQELMHLWDQLDRGHLKEDEAFEEADKSRAAQAGGDGEGTVNINHRRGAEKRGGKTSEECCGVGDVGGDLAGVYGHRN